jgi:hypothetical protein
MVEKLSKSQSVVIFEPIEPLIHEIRNRKVILDADLAKVYGVATKVLNQAVKRNAERFSADFAFQLTEKEWNSLRSQIVTSNPSRGAAILRGHSLSTAQLWRQMFSTVSGLLQ